MTAAHPALAKETASGETRHGLRWQVPRRDYVLLPLIFVMTIFVLLGGGEIITRLVYVQDNDVEPCEYIAPAGYRYHPMCTSRTKVWEGPWVTQHFNDCGYRSANACGTLPAGSLRVVVVGSSTARGALVNYDDSFAARAAAALTKQCSGLVDFQNLGSEPPDVRRIDQRMSEALGLHPTAIVMTIGPFDLENLKDPAPAAEAKPPQKQSPLRILVSMLRQSRLFELMQYHLYSDPSFQVRAFLLNGDPADYVRRPLSAAWQQRVDDLGDLLGRITAHTAPANVPVLLFYIPERAQVALAKMSSDPPGVDPFVLGEAVNQAAAKHGVRFLDSTKAFASAPNFQSLFYLTDGHPQAGGHAALAGDVEQAVLSTPAFAGCARK
jgi:GDSL-like Lipase/Acylhydrolase family